ncbi:MAG: M67 family metallopeptidase [Rhodospirillaceae bacterium]
MINAVSREPDGRLEVPSSIMAAIRAAAQQAWPAECCGLLVGEGPRAFMPEGQGGVWQVHRAVPSANVAKEDGAHGQHDRFEVDPEVLLATHRAARAEGLAIIGHYHSHPNAPAAPSLIDLAHAFYGEHAWLIVSVSGPGATPGEIIATAWRPLMPDPTFPAIAFLPMTLQTVTESAKKPLA